MTASNGHNLLGSITGGDLFGDLTNVNADKVFASVDEYNGGGRVVLIDGTWVAPLLDAADNPALASADPKAAEAVDERGAPRPAPDGTAPDLGAFELTQLAVVQRAPSAGDDLVLGIAGTDRIDALGGNDTVLGAAGNDLLWGRNGSDLLLGGAGNDAIYGGSGTDTVDGGAGDDRLDGGDGIDTATYADAAAGVVVSLAVGGAQATGGAGRDTLVGIEQLVGSGFDDRLTGSSHPDILVGGRGDDDVRGGAGNDIIRGMDGDDVLAGGAGADTIDGGKGEDTVTYASAPGAVQVSIPAGTATGSEGADLLFSIEHVVGSAYSDRLVGGGVWLSGGGGDDVLQESATYIGGRLDGNAGNDVLRGSVGNDELMGGAGDDLLEGGSDNDWTIEGDIASYTDVGAAVRVSLVSTVPQQTGGGGRDTLHGIESLTGSRFADALFGNGAANSLDGGDGDDTLIGGGGNDRLIGGKGADTVDYAAAPGAVIIDLNTGNAFGKDGTDFLSDIENIVGSRFADTIYGSGIEGGQSNDLRGGAGDDVLFGDVGEPFGADLLTGGAGKDRFGYGYWAQSTPQMADTITDFEGVGAASGDRIDLAEVYDGRLTFMGTAAFTGVGQVRVIASGDDTLVLVNLVGTRAPEMEIHVQDGSATPGQWVAGDFIL